MFSSTQTYYCYSEISGTSIDVVEWHSAQPQKFESCPLFEIANAIEACQRHIFFANLKSEPHCDWGEMKFGLIIT